MIFPHQCCSSYVKKGSAPPSQTEAADCKFSALVLRPPPPPSPFLPLCLCSHHPKLTGLAQLQLNKKGIASVKTQFTNMTSPLPWLEI